MARDPFSALLRWLTDNREAMAAARLEGITTEDMQTFDALLALARLERFCRELDENAANEEESSWQSLLERYSWVIAPGLRDSTDDHPRADVCRWQGLQQRGRQHS